MTEEQKRATIDAIKDLIASKKESPTCKSCQQKDDPRLNKPVSKTKAPQIGDKGDPDTQKKEDEERQKKAVKDDAGDDVSPKDSDKKEDNSGIGKDSKDEKFSGDDKDKKEGNGNDGSEDDKKDGEKNGNGSKDGKTNKPFGDPDKIAKRLKDLKKIMEDESGEIKKSLLREDEESRLQERINKQGADLRSYRDTPLYRFKESLNSFIAKETSIGRAKTWKRFSKNYSNSEILRPGTSRYISGKVPLINVYFDQSASWDEAKIAVGRQAIATLKKYVQAGQIKIKVYYFSDVIFTDLNAKDDKGRLLAGNATGAGPEIIEHVKATHADNVIVMTDSDTDWQGNWSKVSPVTVPGAVWYLFLGGRATKLLDYLRGARLTKAFDLETYD